MRERAREEVVGRLRSACLAAELDATLEVEVLGEPVDAVAVDDALVDPANERIWSNPNGTRPG